MREKSKPLGLTPRDLDVMNILWKTENSMTASEIVDANPELTINTVQAVIRKLLKKELIYVKDIVYSGTVLSRSYRPTVNANDFAIMQFTAEFNNLQGEISKASLVAALLDSETDKEKTLQEIEVLQNMLNDYKKNF